MLMRMMLLLQHCARTASSGIMYGDSTETHHWWIHLDQCSVIMLRYLLFYLLVTFVFYHAW